ncbi:hypothetical protein L4D76_19510 [Photobacterium sagamiensis]|uniref:hypothetical protein n=1 Tax=Photobacterium sagamiensis TaxID=2910241 RepID=UPI003D113C95
MMIKDDLLKRLLNEFGQPYRTTKKIQAWDITSRYGLVVESDKPNHGEYASVWLPHPFASTEFPDISLQVYPQNKGRHSNTYASAGLERGEAALKLKVVSRDDIDRLIAYLRP